MRALTKFFAITFAVSWALWLLAAMVPANFPGRTALFLPGTVTPALAALWLTVSREKKTGARALLRRLVAWRVSPGWYVLALGYMAGIKLAAACIQRAITGEWPAFGSMPVVLLFLAALVSTPVQAGEELGWRGYALPRMATAIGLRWSSVLLGVVWAAWHLPLFFIPGVDLAGQSFLVFMLDVTALSVAFSYLYERTNGSLLLVMLLHAAVNNTTGIVPASVEASGVFGMQASLMGWLTGLLLWITAAYFLWRMPLRLEISGRANYLPAAPGHCETAPT
jgi:uncharacterized protein